MMDSCFLIVVVVHCFVSSIHGLHLEGTWNSDDFMFFLAKFGFQKADSKQPTDTQGYIYGNITSSAVNGTFPGTFVVTDSEYFLEFYSHRKVTPRTKACHKMFLKIDTAAWDEKCRPDGEEDFLRKVPCPMNELCIEEDNKKIVVPGFQFTYRIQDTKQPRFWFVSMVACQRNSDNTSGCYWTHGKTPNVQMKYDIYFVNGDPKNKHFNPFEHQFSFEQHDVVEIYLIFFVLYTFLVPLQLYAVIKLRHVISHLLMACMLMEYVGVLLNTGHILKFAFDGKGVEPLKIVGDFIDTASQSLFMLLLLFLAKGWHITARKLNRKAVVYGVWGTYTLIYLFLFVWNFTEIDTISDKDEWQTWPGYLILVFRMGIMIWFVYELLNSFSLENNQHKRRFYLHFGAGFLVWFIYLPIVALVGAEVSALWRYKTILCMTCAADFLSFAVLVHLLWPREKSVYFDLHPPPRVFRMSDLEMTNLLSDDSDIEHMNVINHKKPTSNGHTPSSRDIQTNVDEDEDEEDDVYTRQRPVTSYSTEA